MREIAEHHLPTLLRACGLRDGDELPPQVVEKFWEYKRIRDRCEMSDFAPHEYYVICLLAGQAAPKPVDDKPKTVLQLAAEGELKEGDPIVVKWRNKDVFATFQGVTPRKQVLVMLDGEGDTREVSAKQVTLELAEV